MLTMNLSAPHMITVIGVPHDRYTARKGFMSGSFELKSFIGDQIDLIILQVLQRSMTIT